MGGAPPRERRGRLAAFALVAVAVGSGITGLAVGGAPASYALINAGALGLVALALAIPADRRSALLPTVVVIAGAASVLATLVLADGPEGVHRWISVGSVRLHAGLIVVPATVAALALLRPAVAAVAACALATAFWLQPDAASSLALVSGLSASALAVRDWRRWLAAFAALAGLAAAALRPDPLQPVRFVETALGDAAGESAILAIAMALALLSAIALAPHLVVDQPHKRAAAWGAVGAFGGYAVISLALPFPQPLIGYGASPIVGMALALAVLRFSR